MTHTKEPWEAIDCGNDAEWDVVKPDAQAIDGHWFVATCHDCADGAPASANARRIVSCVNALAGKPDPAAYVAAMDACVEALEAVAPYLTTMLVDDDPDDETIGWQSDGEGGHTKPIDFTMGQIRKVNTALQSARATKGNA